MATPESAQEGRLISAETRMAYLYAQISYLTSHIQIADAKAAGIVAYLSVLNAYTASKLAPLSSIKGLPFAWLGAGALGLGVIGIVAAFIAIIPRRMEGRSETETFSWVGVSIAVREKAYSRLIQEHSYEDLQASLADTVKTISLMMDHKYRLTVISSKTALTSSVGQLLYWLLASPSP
jgi:hypothetical protein